MLSSMTENAIIRTEQTFILVAAVVGALWLYKFNDVANNMGFNWQVFLKYTQLQLQLFVKNLWYSAVVTSSWEILFKKRVPDVIYKYYRI